MKQGREQRYRHWRQGCGIVDRPRYGPIVAGLHAAVCRSHCQAGRGLRQLRIGFPEDQAASFGLLLDVSCWRKRHHPDALLAGLLSREARLGGAETESQGCLRKKLVAQ